MTQPIKSIREWRELRAYTLDELARAAGVKLQTLWNWEVGRAYPRPTNKRKLAQALGVSVEQIDWEAKAQPKTRAA